jgi:hypothetical protein
MSSSSASKPPSPNFIFPSLIPVVLTTFRPVTGPSFGAYYVPTPFQPIFSSHKSVCVTCNAVWWRHSSLLVVYWHAFNCAQYKHVTRRPLSCCVCCLKKRRSVRDYIIRCSMQSSFSVINNLLHFLLMFPDSFAACNPSHPWQISAGAVKCERVFCVVFLTLGLTQEKRLTIKNIYNLHSTCSRFENISLLDEVDANSNKKIKINLCVCLQNGSVHLIISYLSSRVAVRHKRIKSWEVK